MQTRMKRRTLLKRGLAGAVLGSFPGVASLAGGKPGLDDELPWREFEVTTTVSIADPVGAPRAWIPVPIMTSTPWFKRMGDTWRGNFKSASRIEYDDEGTAFVFARWGTGESNPTIEITSRFMARDRHVDLDHPPDPRVHEDPDVLRRFLEPSRLKPIGGIVATTANSIVDDLASDLEKARAIYDWIVENTFRDPKVRGCGTGDIGTMLKTGYFGGKCADLNSLYVGLARAAGLPARDALGIRCAPSATFHSLGTKGDITRAQHCRAEVYLDGYGWVPVDPADVRKVVLEEDASQQLALDSPIVRKARDMLFGGWEMNWLLYNHAEDIELPYANGPELAFFMYPQAEDDISRRDALDPARFRYRITARQLAA